jgi:hypothetical protein
VVVNGAVENVGVMMWRRGLAGVTKGVTTGLTEHTLWAFYNIIQFSRLFCEI